MFFRTPSFSDRPHLWFSFSSCRSGFLGAWSSTHAIGVDLEDKNAEVEPLELSEQFFANSETKMLHTLSDPERRDAFLQLWCLKEAALKSIGEGLPFGMDAFEFEMTPDVRVVRAPHDYGGPRAFSAFLRPAHDSFSALVIRDQP
jgi:phosphopantetheine--protein transferase-like protein